MMTLLLGLLYWKNRVNDVHLDTCIHCTCILHAVMYKKRFGPFCVSCGCEIVSPSQRSEGREQERGSDCGDETASVFCPSLQQLKQAPLLQTPRISRHALHYNISITHNREH